HDASRSVKPWATAQCVHALRRHWQYQPASLTMIALVMAEKYQSISRQRSKGNNNAEFLL
ncbi:hypothetical protein CHS0354_026522, partial [Potamilus streckersoni]